MLSLEGMFLLSEPKTVNVVRRTAWMRDQRYRDRRWVIQYIGKKGKPGEKYDLKGPR